ncbi:MAG TPA: FadD3 family acyl-CoA ligase [Actinomycetota bacterium]|nr:FadD3 family acyl-CoA ligase [Actinomycetota bacterium]
MWGTIPNLIRWAAEEFGDDPAVADGSVQLTFAELADRVAESAAAATAAGVQPGDRVAIWAPNTHRWILAALGAVAAGGVLVPINTRFKGREAGYVLEKSGARLLFTMGEFLGTAYVDLLRDALGGEPTESLPSLERVVLLDDAESHGGQVFDEYLLHGHVVSPEEVERRAGQLTSDHLSDVIFTSGTTGKPKGVMTTHGQSLRVFEVWSRLVGLTRGDRYLVVNPFFHTFGYKAGILAAIMRGATVHPHAVFDAEQVMRRIEAEGITFLPGPPTLYQSILNHPDRIQHDLSSLRVAVTGAAVVPVELIRRMREELTFETILTAYGLTESTGTATMCRPGDDEETIAATSGRAIPDTEVRVVDDRGQPLGRGMPGDVVIRGYNVMQGYFEDLDATAEAIDQHGWLHTGDIGVMDDRSYLRITDRKKDVFIVGGFNAYPAEIENELLRHPVVGQVAVVGVPDERLGEVGVAFVVPRPDATADPDELIAWARDQMANYKVPRRVEVVQELPMNASGKVLKFELRERAAPAEVQ